MPDTSWSSGFEARLLDDTPGTSQSLYTDWDGRRYNIALGSQAEPFTETGPKFKLSYVENLTTAQTGNKYDAEANPGFLVIGRNTPDSQQQLSPIVAGGVLTSEVAGTDSFALTGQSRAISGAVGIAAGAYLHGRRDTATARAQGGEIRVSNRAGTDGVYSSGSMSDTLGLWVVAASATGERSAAGIQIGRTDTAQFVVGLGFMAGSVQTSTIRDDSSSTATLDIRGSHTYGIDARNGTLTAVIRAANNVNLLTARNAANTADLAMLRLNAADRIVLLQTSELTDGKDLAVGTTTGTKIGTAATQKLGFFGKTPIVRPTGAPADATDLASAIALVNHLKNNVLVPLGLAA